MTKPILNRIPTVDDKIYAIEQSAVTEKAPDFLKTEDKTHFISALYYQKRSFTVDSVSRSEKSPDYVNIKASNGKSIEFPKFIDTPEKAASVNRFFSDEEEVNEEIERLTNLEVKRCEQMIEEYTKQRQFLAEILNSKSY